MALSYIEYLGSGTTNLFNVPFPYLRKEHVRVFANALEIDIASWPTEGTIRLDTSAASLAGKTIRVRRVTPADELEAIFKAGPLAPEDLNAVHLQLLYLAQEAYDNAGIVAGDDDGDDVGGIGDGGDGTTYPPIIVGDESMRPADPVDGQVFFNTTTKKIEIYRCGGDPVVCAWVVYDWLVEIPPTNIIVGGTEPTDPVEGMIWFDTVNKIIKIWESGAWVSYDWLPTIPPSGITLSGILPASALDGAVHFNPDNNTIYFREAGAWVGYPWGVEGDAAIITVALEADLPAGAVVGTVGVTTTPPKLYVKGADGWTSNLAEANLGPGSISTDMLAANVVVAGKIAAGAITAIAIAANTITGDKIAAATISAVNLQASSITTDKLAAGAVTATKIAAATITGDRMVAFTIGADQLAANSITAGKIAAGVVTGDKIAGNTITGDKLAVFSITADRIQTNTLILGTTNLTAGSVSEVLAMAGSNATVSLLNYLKP